MVAQRHMTPSPTWGLAVAGGLLLIAIVLIYWLYF